MLDNRLDRPAQSGSEILAATSCTISDRREITAPIQLDLTQIGSFFEQDNYNTFENSRGCTRDTQSFHDARPPFHEYLSGQEPLSDCRSFQTNPQYQPFLEMYSDPGFDVTNVPRLSAEFSHTVNSDNQAQPYWCNQTNTDSQTNPGGSIDFAGARSQTDEEREELPDLFFAHDPVEYAEYKDDCSRGYSDFNGFKRNSLKKHRARGDLERENISDERFNAALHVKPQGKYGSKAEKNREVWKLMRYELFGTDLSVPIPECRDHPIRKAKRPPKERKGNTPLRTNRASLMPPVVSGRSSHSDLELHVSTTFNTVSPSALENCYLETYGDGPHEYLSTNTSTAPNGSEFQNEAFENTFQKARFVEQRLSQVQNPSLHFQYTTAVRHFDRSIDALYNIIRSSPAELPMDPTQQQGSRSPFPLSQPSSSFTSIGSTQMGGSFDVSQAMPSDQYLTPGEMSSRSSHRPNGPARRARSSSGRF